MVWRVALEISSYRKLTTPMKVAIPEAIFRIVSYDHCLHLMLVHTSLIKLASAHM